MNTFVPILILLMLVAVALLVFLPRRKRGSTKAGAPFPSRAAAPHASAPAPTAVVRGQGLGAKVRSLFAKGTGDETWSELEDLLIKADVGPTAAADIVARIRADFRSDLDPSELLRDELVAILGPDQPLGVRADRLSVVLVVGVNGSGKTTTIGKLASRLAAEGKKVSLAASDTFRAAAGEQLDAWAQRAGAHIVAQDRGADPGAVAFDAVKSSIARGTDVLIVDTAGRLHTKQPLMEELKKVKRVIEKAGATVDETLLVLDAQTGQNGIAQARAFTEAVDVTGVVLTKMDGSAKGGIVLAVREELGVPVRFVGDGEGLQDLRPFEARTFAERLLAG
ncbi:MAG: signal recognition particle-docking protein FtsY [Actinomycetota bacterium]|nr:signal recognition particle-docking protein FtsY [Actinomycetota bacterium]